MSRTLVTLTMLALGAVAAPAGPGGDLAAQSSRERAAARADSARADSARQRARSESRGGTHVHVSGGDLAGLGEALQLGLRLVLNEGVGRGLGSALDAGLRGVEAGIVEGMEGLAEGLATLDGALADDEHSHERRRDDDRRDRRDRSEARLQDYRIDSTVSLGRNGSVELKLISGPITVTAWDRDEVRVRATSTEIPIYLDRSGSSVRAGVRDENRWSRSGGGRGRQTMEVMVPVGTRVSASSISGDVSVRGVRGEVEASSVSGDIAASEITRRARLNSVSGSVVADRIEGDVVANGVSGGVTLTDVDGDLEVQTVSGAIRLRGIRSANVKSNSVSGRVSYEGSFERDGRYDFNSFSGAINLGLPANASGSLGIQTFSGSIDSDFAITMQPGMQRGTGPSKRNLEFTLGEGGGARLTAKTFSGSINLRRGALRADNRE
jgi:DUF4097 and DUF4098 domain-containing protein YvlB